MQKKIYDSLRETIKYNFSAIDKYFYAEKIYDSLRETIKYNFSAKTSISWHN